VLVCAVKLVLHSLGRYSTAAAIELSEFFWAERPSSHHLCLCALYVVRGSALELIVAVDTVLDKASPIFSFRREQNGAAHDLALALLAECTAIWKEGGGTKIRQCPKDPKFGLLVDWTKGGAPATLSKCEVGTHMHCMHKADASEIVKTGDIVRAAYDLNYGKDHGVVVAGCLGTISDIPAVSSGSTASWNSSESNALWNVTWHRTNNKGSLVAKAQGKQFQKCKPNGFLSEGDILRPCRDLKIALKAIGTGPSMSLPGEPAGTITITKDTLVTLEKLHVFYSDD
jgi:hypothetical protein